ncbi:hypothetical protein PIB30_006411 [Stylosanthes scabra]|uniref:Uncharacterized protein n=1 Tax=Stylosanthes scabra TaxID=79078 RepID=A0ABU6T4L5_9FABA|nr:hypothetical protein [Stylosanthes scabra]
MLRSHSSPGSLLFDPEIERTLRRTRQARRRAELARLALGGASTAFDNQPNQFPELNANFELKSGLINLLPKFCGRPGEDPSTLRTLRLSVPPLEGPVKRFLESTFHLPRRMLSRRKSLKFHNSTGKLCTSTTSGSRNCSLRAPIETVSDANQHLGTRAKSRGIHEVTTSESDMLAKTLAEVVAMVKEIKDGQQAYAANLKQNSNNSYVKPIKHCGI